MKTYYNMLQQLVLLHLLLFGSISASSQEKQEVSDATTLSDPTRDLESSSTSSSYYCGTSWYDASQCKGAKCLSGLDSECPSGQYCYANVTCSFHNFCGANLLSVAVDPNHVSCPNGTDSECPVNQTCFKDFRSECGGTTSYFGNYCGKNWYDAHECRKPCPCGMDYECPEGMGCFSGIACGGAGNYCGTSFYDASQCSSSGNVACPNGKDSDCPRGQSCQPDVTCKYKNYCGIDWVAAQSGKCQSTTPCPNGLNTECPSGEICWGAIKCDCGGTSNVYGNYCGVDSLDAAETCGIPCPCGMDVECPFGQHCFAQVKCARGNHCGTTWENAAKCNSTACPLGLDSECPVGQACFAGIDCSTHSPTRSPTMNNVTQPVKKSSGSVLSDVRLSRVVFSSATVALVFFLIHLF